MTSDWLDTAEKLSRTLSIAAIPIVVALGGWLIQRQLQDQTIKRDYVQLAVSILQNPDPSKVPPEIREWAVDLLDDNSPTKLNAQAIANLKSGKVTLSGFTFVPSSALTPDLKKHLEEALVTFKAYLAKLGFESTLDIIPVDIRPGTLVDGKGIAIWDPESHSIQVASAFAGDDATVLRQFAHNLLIPSGQVAPDYYAIESGLATYFPCSFTNSPMLGDKASAAGKALLPPRDLRNPRKFPEIHTDDWTSVQNDGSEVWGGAFWALRQLMGQEAADRLIANTWQSSTPPKAGRAYVTFANHLLTNSGTIENGKYADQIREIFKARGLKL